MVKILISELQPAGSELFSGSENFMDSVRDLSVEELKVKGGGSKSKKKSGSGKYYCPCPPPPCY